MNIMIAGDLVPTDKNISIFENGEISEKIDKNFITEWNKSDYRIINLECPICDKNKHNKILKFGPSLSCTNKSINGILQLNPSLMLLSNNHILDYGVNGLGNTLKILKDKKIPYIGIKENIFDKNNIYIFEKDNIKVGIYNFCDNEFSVPTNDNSGAANTDILSNYLEIKNAKRKCDYLIILYHGGKEYYRYPSPNLQKFCRYLVEIGADIVVCQHSHCIGCQEEYNKGTIVYGIGNFIFDDSDNEYERNSLLLSISFSPKKYDIKYIPIEKKNGLIQFSNEKTIIEDFNYRSESIKDTELLYKKYNDFSKDKLNSYMKIFRKNNIFERILNRFFIKNYYVKLYSKEDFVKLLNIIECDAHREVIINAIKNKIYGEKK